MIQELLSVNWLAVVACGVVLMIIGFAWYTLFAKPWSELSGWTREKVAQVPQNQMMMSYGITFLTALLTVFVLAGMLHLTRTTAIPGALALAGVVWAGFTAGPTISNFAFERRPWALWAITSGNTLVSLLISAVILVLWK